MSRVVNCLQLLRILSNGQVYKKAYLAELLGTLPRNLHSYRLELYEAGYDIESIPGQYGGYRLSLATSLPMMSLNTEDYEYLRLLQAYISNSAFTYHKEASMSLNKLTSSQQRHSDNLFYHAQSHERDVLSKHTLELLDNAITLHKMVSFDYVRSDKQHSKRVVKPYAVVNYLDFWYLVAEDQSDSKIKYFKVSKRMSNVEMTHKDFMYDSDFNINHYLQSEYFFKFETQDVICNITGQSALLIEERTMGRIKKMYWDNDVLHYHATFDSLDHATRFVMSCHTDIDIVGPATFKAHILSTINKMILKY